jgi:hypothetical protein
MALTRSTQRTQPRQASSPADSPRGAFRATSRHLNELPDRKPGQTTGQGHRKVVAEAARYLGAVSILLVGGVHAQQYYYAYFSVVPTIGTLFLLSFIGAGIVGAVLISPVRLLGRTVGDAALVVAALGAIGIAVGTLVSLLISEYTPLFGFMESGYRLAVELTLLFDVTTTVFLGAFLALVAPQLIRALATRKRPQ